MNYKITEQYARSEEKLIAEFNELNDVYFFLAKKISNDEMQHKKVIYRLYDDLELLHKWNKEDIAVAYAQYAEGDCDFINPQSLQFNVMIQGENSLERKCIANFTDQNDAHLFIIEKCETDNRVEDNDLFLIISNLILIQTLNKIMIANQKIKAEGAQGPQSDAIFRPTPMPSRPVPPGWPSDCWVEKDDEE